MIRKTIDFFLFHSFGVSDIFIFSLFFFLPSSYNDLGHGMIIREKLCLHTKRSLNFTLSLISEIDLRNIGILWRNRRCFATVLLERNG